MIPYHPDRRLRLVHALLREPESCPGLSRRGHSVEHHAKGSTARVDRRSVVGWSALENPAGVGLTIACYSAAISSEPGNTTGCRRGGIAGRWTKPVAATQFVASRRKPICCGGGDLGNCISA